MIKSFFYRLARVFIATAIGMGIARMAKADELTYQRALRSTVLVVNRDENGAGLGTGALIDAQQRLVVTAGHVVGAKGEVIVCFPDFSPDGRAITQRSHYLGHLIGLGIRAKVLARDTTRDVAIIQLDRVPEGMAAIPLATRRVTPGQAVSALGNSGMDDDDFMWCYRDGSVRQACRKTLHSEGGIIDANMIETTIASNHGDSGGPVLNARGELVAITISHHSDGEPQDVGQLIGYCTDVCEVREVLQTALAAMTPNVAMKINPPFGGLLAAPAPSRSVAITEAFAAPSGDQTDSIDVNAKIRAIGCIGHRFELIATLTDTSGNVLRDINGRPCQAVLTVAPRYDDTDNANAVHPVTLRFAGGNIRNAENNGAGCGFLVSARDIETGEWLTSAASRVDYSEPTVTRP